MRAVLGEAVLVLRRKPAKKRRVRDFLKRFRKQEPTTFHKFLAVHIQAAGSFSLLE